MSCMPFKVFTMRLQRLISSSKSKASAAGREKRGSRALQISAPFNFKHETVSLPGLSEDDIALLKEKVAASRFGVTDVHDGGPSAFGSPRKAPRAPPSPVRIVAPAVLAAPGTPLSPEDNVI
ncbi:hypothetical protein F4777DRAFT_91530 [Nemania sp. FL0916]|nr:hypothetical protein F4777DRAFT_91530 [Nemania sp. FL0916]